MTERSISALQLAFLVFAATFAGAVASHGPASALSLSREDHDFVSRAVTVILEAAIVLGFTQLRRGAMRVLATPFSTAYIGETGAVLGIALLAQFAHFGVVALARWMHGADAAVSIMHLNPAVAMDGAWSASTVRNLLLAGFIIPVLEELLFRGAIFERLKARHSTLVAMLLTSLAFALCHDNFVFAFVVGVLLNSVYVRTGSLRVAILVHSAVNLASWHPLLGQFLVPQPNDGIRSWSWHLACIVMFGTFTVAYALLASRRPRPTLGPQAAAQSP